MITEELHSSLINILTSRGYTEEMVNEQIQAIYEMTLLEAFNSINMEMGKQLEASEITKYISGTGEKHFSQEFEKASIKVMDEYFAIIG